MSEKIDFVWEDSGCVLTIKGRIEKADMRELAVPTHHDERGSRAKYVVVDLLEADYSRISHRDISLVITHSLATSFQNPGLRIAVVATDPRVVEMSEYYRSSMVQLDVSWEMRIFQTMEDARAWIAG